MPLVATSLRRLNEGVDYGKFRKAWLPDEVFPGDPRRVISALDLADPQQILTLALINATADEIPAWMQRIAASEQRRISRLEGLVGPQLAGAVYRVVGDDDLSMLIKE